MCELFETFCIYYYYKYIYCKTYEDLLFKLIVIFFLLGLYGKLRIINNHACDEWVQNICPILIEICPAMNLGYSLSYPHLGWLYCDHMIATIQLKGMLQINYMWWMGLCEQIIAVVLLSSCCCENAEIILLLLLLLSHHYKINIAWNHVHQFILLL